MSYDSVFKQAFSGISKVQALALLSQERLSLQQSGENELMSIVSTAGDIISQEGNREVRITATITAKSILTHNHPFPVAFSELDIDVFLRLPIKEMRVVARREDRIFLWRIVKQKAYKTSGEPKPFIEQVKNKEKPSGKSFFIWVDYVIHSESAIESPIKNEKGKTLSKRGNRIIKNKYDCMRRNFAFEAWVDQYKRYFEYIRVDVTDLFMETKPLKK